MTQIREGGVEIPAATREETTMQEVYHRALEGTFYDDHDWASGPALRVLHAAAAYTPTPSPEIAEQPMGEVNQADRDYAADYGLMVSRLTARDADNVRAGKWDETEDVLFFTRRRTNAVRTIESTDPSASPRNDIAGLPGHGMSADVQVAEQRVGEVADTGFKRWIKSYVGEINPGSCRYSVDEMRIAFEAGSATPKPADPTSVAGERMVTLRDALSAAYVAGCIDTHENYQPDRAPEFGEAGSDYASEQALILFETLEVLATNAPDGDQ